MKAILPKYLIRPSDFTRFDMIEDGKYVHQGRDEKGWFTNKYSYETLHNIGFYPAMENELEQYNKLHADHYAFLGWQSRPDGHGGSKGGTPEEYAEYLERVKRYQNTWENKN